jgi:hypothetical protein
MKKFHTEGIYTRGPGAMKADTSAGQAMCSRLTANPPLYDKPHPQRSRAGGWMIEPS